MFDETQSQPFGPEDLAEGGRGFHEGAGPSGVAIHVPGCRIVRELHRGGQGVVYLAVQLSTHRPVAVKVLLERGGTNQTSRKRFLQEIRLIAKMQHPHIVTLFDSGETSDGRLFYVMEYVRGVPLRMYARQHKLSFDQVLELFAVLCEAVEALHKRGIVHRDLKPSNVLVDPQGRLVVLDLGLATTLSAGVETIISEPGDLLGTVAYMSPEQAGMTGEELDARSDVYSLGVMLYELLTGTLPHSTKGPLHVILQRIRESPPIPLRTAWTAQSGARLAEFESGSNAACPIGSEIDTIVQVCLANERGRRYQSAGELAVDLRRYLRGEPIVKRADSFSYVLSSGLRRFMLRHRRVGALALAGVAALVAAISTRMFVYGPNAVDRSFEEWAAGIRMNQVDMERFDLIRLVAIRDDTSIAKLAAMFNLSDVSDQSADSLPSVRRLHGRMMERLALSACSAVVWDFMFRRESEFDADFLQGIRALKNAGIPVIVGVESWWSGDLGLPTLSPVIAAETRWGSLGVHFQDYEPWSIPLLVRKGTGDTLGSLAMESLAAARFPLAVPDYHLDLDHGTARMRIASVGTWGGLAGWTSESVPLLFTSRYTDTKKPDEKYGLREGDSYGLVDVSVPSDEVLEDVSVAYQDVFHASTETLRNWFSGRIVLIGNLRTGNDRHGYPGGRSVPGLYGHAAAINTLLQSSYRRFSGGAECWLGAIAGAGLASLILWSVRRAHVVCLTGIAVFVACAAIVFIAIRFGRSVINPSGFLVGFTVSLALGMWAQRALGLPVKPPQENYP